MKLSRQVDTGSDPFERGERLKAEPPFKEFSEIYLARQARPHKRSADKDACHLGRSIDSLKG